MNPVNNLLKIRGRAVGLDVENGERLMREGKAKCTAYLTKGIRESHDERSNHMTKLIPQTNDR